MSAADPSEDLLVQRQRLYEYEAEFEAQNAALQEAYEELNRSRDRYRSLFEESPVAFVLVDRETNMLQVNAQAEAILGRGREGLLGRSFMNRVTAVHHVGLRTNLDIALLRGRRTTTIVRLAGEDVETWVRLDCGRLDLGGEPRVLVGVRDITRQHLAEDALRTSEARFRALFEASLDAVALLDGASLTLQEVNPSFVRLTGIGPEDLIGQRIRTLFPEEQRWAVSATLRQALHRGAAGPLAVAVEQADGSLRRVELSATAVRVGGGLFAMVSLRDVHEQWLAVQRRRATERRLWEVQKVEMLGAMAGGIAHDVNNTLASIHGLAQALLADLDGSDSEHARDLRQILDATTRGRDLTHNLLGFTRRDGAQKRTVDLSTLVERTRSLAERGLAAQVRLVDQVPSQPKRVEADPAQLEHVLLNLVRHAAAREPTAAIRIELDLERFASPDDAVGELEPGEYVCVRVVDNGQPMDPDALATAYEPRLDPTGGLDGVGLALNMVRTTIEEFDGEVESPARPTPAPPCPCGCVGSTARSRPPTPAPAEPLPCTACWSSTSSPWSCAPPPACSPPTATACTPPDAEPRASRPFVARTSTPPWSISPCPTWTARPCSASWWPWTPTPCWWA